MYKRQLQRGKKPDLCPHVEQLDTITTADVGRAAQAGDPLALRILQAAGEQLGKGLSIVIDLLNPERIIIGSIFARCQEQLWPAAERVIAEETLPAARAACSVVPCALSESVGDIAALTVALYYQEKENTYEHAYTANYAVILYTPSGFDISRSRIVKSAPAAFGYLSLWRETPDLRKWRQQR